MDPVSAFGLAVNVLAVVDFSKTFLEVLKQVKDAGSSAATQDIVSISRSLQASCVKIKLPTSVGTDDKAFMNLIEECQNLAEELIRLVEKISTAGSSDLMKRIKVTALTMWSHSKIEEKKERLRAIRGQLLFNIVVPMAATVHQIPDMTAIDTQTRTLLDEIKAGQDANAALERRLRAFHEEYATVQAERHTEIVSILNDIRGSKSQPVTSTTADCNDKSKQLILKDLLNFLYFPQEVDRFYDIKPAHKGTFEWVYSEPRSGANRATWANFHEWLRNDSGIYWISGKAGSGKSTLMKLIGTDERTRQPLLEWSAGSRLLILSFYFWNPGTPLQKSLEGLLRSIISQALKECPELAESSDFART
ncbi:hypothetical protein KHU50_006326 [Colletotrichum sp. SAR 10_65]|nr:hypothetical protein KHU50_006326 [Colletotrichum sp. SAR 10_65]